MMVRDKKVQRDQLGDEIVRIEANIQKLISAVDYGEQLMDHLANPAIASFIKSWSVSEKRRLADLRMKLPLDAKDDHLDISIQHKIMDKFGKEPEFVQETVNENKATLERARDSLMSKQAKLNKLKE
jgi:hypothetical protein